MTIEAQAHLDSCIPTPLKLEIVDLIAALSSPINYSPPFFPEFTS